MNRALASVAAAALAALLCAGSVRADEIKLKDGSKIIGTIVGFEDNSFKVKTSYGFAVVQKDQVVSITVTDAASNAATDSGKKPAPAPTKATAAAPPSLPSPPPAKPARSEHVSAAPTPPPASSANTEHAAAAPAQAKSAEPTPAADDATVEYPHTDSPAPETTAPPAEPAPNAASNSAQPAKSASATPAATPVAAPLPPKPAAPEPMREEVSGNTYTNETYGFQMYKPPDWNLIAGARAILPGSITALGTDDHNTYLLIGQQPAGQSLATDMAATEQRLREVMDNFRPLGEKHVTISGLSATEHHFRGSVDERDWSGVVVYIPRGARVYTIFGMTLADTDLVQIQENVISRTISSLQFTKP
ncbi:MAG: hypothetical protein WA192_05345 [Candidatus Acidiferrales bacterium]